MKRLASITLIALAAACVHGRGLGRVRFVVVDAATRRPVSGVVTVGLASGESITMAADANGRTQTLDVLARHLSPEAADTTLVTIPVGVSASLQQDPGIPTKEIVIKVSASRLVKPAPPAGSSGTVRTNQELQKFGGGGHGNDTQQLTKGQAGVAEDSAGQVHVRGEHAEITFVVDGVPFPDTLSGRQGSVVVPSDVQSVDMITGGYAPEFGGQTAAILDIKTLTSLGAPHSELTTSASSPFGLSTELTSLGALSSRFSYVLDIGASRTSLNEEAPQPTDQSAHNGASATNVFAKLRFDADSRDTYTLTLARNRSDSQIANRTGLSGAYAAVGQGYGLFGLRNQDGSLPMANQANPGGLGSTALPLLSQDAAGQDITQKEVSEYATLSLDRTVSATTRGLLALTVMHNSADLVSNNPGVDLSNLPVDNSIEYNPTTTRSVHHVQLTGSLDTKLGNHDFKLGLLYDSQVGRESYSITPASQLALDELVAVDPGLAPPGTPNGQIDVYGNPVYIASGAVPTVTVDRVASYRAAYLQDTWKLGKLTTDFGLRADWYLDNQDIGQPNVDALSFSPRLNLAYSSDKSNEVRASYNRLFNTPPLAQGALVGQAIQPELINQYDLGWTHSLGANQTFNLAYYYKDIRDQVDTGLLVPGSQIGLYSAVNFQIGAVHGVEAGYQLTAKHGVGWDSFVNYSYSEAAPNGNDNTGALAPNYNDHDQRQTLGLGAAYTWASGASFAATLQHGSGLASSIVPPSASRTPRTQVDVHFTTGDHFFQGNGGLSLDVTNLFDDRTVINFESGFSGTRFQTGRSIVLSATRKF